jgi:hypothetical protein
VATTHERLRPAAPDSDSRSPKVSSRHTAARSGPRIGPSVAHALRSRFRLAAETPLDYAESCAAVYGQRARLNATTWQSHDDRSGAGIVKHLRPYLVAALVVAGGRGVYRLLASGSLTLDVGIGRRVRPLGPLTWRIAAPPEIVFDVIADPYLGRTPRALEGKLQVWERATDMVLAAHFTPVKCGATTAVETRRPSRTRLGRGGSQLNRSRNGRIAAPCSHLTTEAVGWRTPTALACRRDDRSEAPQLLPQVKGLSLFGGKATRNPEQSPVGQLQVAHPLVAAGVIGGGSFPRELRSHRK